MRGPPGRVVFVFASRASADQKVLHLPARSKLRRQPAGLFTAARPSLGRIFRVPVFGKNLRVRTALAVRGDNFAGRSELLQPLLKSGLFYCQFASQFRGYLFMELPQVIDGHRFQIAVFHLTPVVKRTVAGMNEHAVYIFSKTVCGTPPEKKLRNFFARVAVPPRPRGGPS